MKMKQDFRELNSNIIRKLCIGKKSDTRCARIKLGSRARWTKISRIFVFTCLIVSIRFTYILLSQNINRKTTR